MRHLIFFLFYRVCEKLFTEKIINTVCKKTIQNPLFVLLPAFKLFNFTKFTYKKTFSIDICFLK